MGGSGGASYPSSREDLEELRSQVLQDLQEQEQQVAINDMLARALAAFNDRDVDATQERLDEVQRALSDALVDIDRLLFGGSVAKHTYVDGLSLDPPMGGVARWAREHENAPLNWEDTTW